MRLDVIADVPADIRSVVGDDCVGVMDQGQPHGVCELAQLQLHLGVHNLAADIERHQARRDIVSRAEHRTSHRHEQHQP